MSDQNKILIELINNAMFGRNIDIQNANDINYASIFLSAQRHKVTNLIYLGIKNNMDKLGVKENVMAVFEKVYKLNLIHSSNQDFVLQELSSVFDKNNIKFMPLKGSILKELYPQPYYRTMGDLDILYKQDEVDDIDKILKKSEFIKREEKDKDKIYIKYGILIELHKSLMDSNNKYHEYFKNVWSKAKQKNNFEYEMTPEDFLIFHIVHMANHCLNGGIGVRFFLDIQVFINKYQESLNWEYYEFEIERLGLSRFSAKVIHLSNVWFGNGEYAEDDESFMAYIFDGGVYGTEYSIVAARKIKTIEETGNKSNAIFILHNLFPPYKQLKQSYGWLKNPLLLPAGWIKLNFGRLRRWRITRHNMKIMMSNQSKDMNNTRNLLDELGLL